MADWDTFFWFMTHISLDNLRAAIFRNDTETGFLQRPIPFFSFH